MGSSNHVGFLRRWVFLLVSLVLSQPVIARADPATSDALRAERRRHGKVMSDEQFSAVHGVVIEDGKPRHLTWVIAATRDPEQPDNAIALWFETARGRVAVKLTDPGGEVLTSWQARGGEQRLIRALPEGTYQLDLTPLDGATTINGVVGVRGPALWPCAAIDPARITEHPADPAHGFSWPYLIARASKPASSLLVVPANTGFETDQVETLRVSASCDVESWLGLADRIGADLLLPMLPRPAVPGSSMYLHALSRDAMLAKPAAIARVDRQLIAMIDDARARAGRPVDPRVWIVGFSAAAMFANRFTVMHPERVRAAAIISPGGWPIAPVASERGQRLTYPVGVADLDRIDRPVDLARLRQVPQLFLLGANDRNDAAPFRDAFDAADEAILLRLFGATPVARWPSAARLYKAAGLDATFKLYPDTDHEVTPKMVDDIAALFARVARPSAP